MKQRRKYVAESYLDYAMSCNMAAPYKTLFIILKILNFLNYSYFPTITTRKPKIGNMTELYPFLESKKWYLLFKEILCWRDVTWKPSIWFS